MLNNTFNLDKFEKISKIRKLKLKFKSKKKKINTFQILCYHNINRNTNKTTIILFIKKCNMFIGNIKLGFKKRNFLKNIFKICLLRYSKLIFDNNWNIIFINYLYFC